MGVYVTIFLYAVTTSVFFPVFQSLVFYKSCVSLSNHTNAEVICESKEAAARDADVHTMANNILLTSSTGLCITAFITSRFIGHLSDVKSRKLAFLIPFAGLFISDFTILIQVLFPRLNPYYFNVSEVIYGIFGGYMSITSGAFAIISTKHTDSTKRAKAIARLEGTISLGSMIGFLISSRLEQFGYFAMASFFVVAHFVAFLSALFMKEIEYHEPEPKLENRRVSPWAICTGSHILKDKPPHIKRNLMILYFSFGISYFAFIGSTRILFFYLKHKFFWGSEKYGYLKAINQAMTTVFAMFAYPALKNLGVTDVRLAIFGLITRSIGRAWYAIAWADYAVFAVVGFEMFSKFPATAMRSLISSNVGEHERGSAFSLVAVIEALCNITSAWAFHVAFPASLKFNFPEFSFIIMPIIIIPAIVLMTFNLRSLESTETHHAPVDQLVPQLIAPSSPAKSVHKEEEPDEPTLPHIATETDTLTDSSNSV